MNTVPIPHLNTQIVLVDRDQLRFRSHGRNFGVPRFLRGIPNSPINPPAVFTWATGITYPLLGNDRYGNCYYTACCHGSQTFTGNAVQGQQAQFDEQAVIRRYLQISGGDNGLDDATMMPEWMLGVVGPNGPHRILDQMTIDPQNESLVALAMWAYCGLIYTAALGDDWVSNPRPGDVWDTTRPNPRNGHAMWLTGKTARATYEVQTWGLNPPIFLTRNGLLSSDPELIVAFSLEKFNKDGIAPCGLTYDQLASMWLQYGGKRLPPSPFVIPPPIPPSPVPPIPQPPVPIPPVPTPPPMPAPYFSLKLPTLRKGEIVRFATPRPTPAGWYDVYPRAKQADTTVEVSPGEVTAMACMPEEVPPQ